MRHIATLIVAISIMGCTTTVHKDIVIDAPPTIHPSLPQPVIPRKVNFEVVNDGDKSFVRMDMMNYQKLSIYMEDILRYIRNSNGVVCHYRHDLNEDFCQTREK